MDSNEIEIKAFHKEFLKPTKVNGICEVSKASSEIMLDRFYNGKEVDFPFSR